MTGSPDESKTLDSINTHEENIESQTQCLNNDAVIGLLRSIGDAGAGPTNSAGKTLLKLLEDSYQKQLNLSRLSDDGVKGLMRSLGDAGAGPTDAAGKTLLKLLDDLHSLLDGRGIKESPAGTVVYQDSVNNGGGGLTTIFDNPDVPTKILALETTASSENTIETKVIPYNENGQLTNYIRTASQGGIQLFDCLEVHVANHNSSVFEIVPCSVQQKLIMRKQMFFPNGCKVQIEEAGPGADWAHQSVVNEYTRGW